MKALKVNIALAAVSGLILTGCVTINIYFPASAAEKAADKIIDEIWQSRGDETPTAFPASGNEKTEKP